MRESNIGSVRNDNESPAGLVAESSDYTGAQHSEEAEHSALLRSCN